MFGYISFTFYNRFSDKGEFVIMFWECFKYGCFLGLFGFFAGRILPKKWFNPKVFPFKPFGFEEDGTFYEKLKVHKWQSHVPDMSRIFTKLMPAKNLSGNYKERLPLMICETCIAETVHGFVMLMGLHFLEIWQGLGGILCELVFCFVFNLPYIVIQRYNRPRLMRIYNRINCSGASSENELEECEI